jgi:hypothetical protein
MQDGLQVSGGIAQLGERNAGSVEVRSSILLASTTWNAAFKSPSSRGLGHDPFTVVTGVRIPYGTPPFRLPASSFSNALAASRASQGNAHLLREGAFFVMRLCFKLCDASLLLR